MFLSTTFVSERITYSHKVTNSTVQSSLQEADSRSVGQGIPRNSSNFMEPKVPIPNSQETAIGSYLEPGESSSHFHTLIL